MSVERARDHDRAQRWASIILGAAVIGLVGWLTLEQTSVPRIKRDPNDGGKGDADVTLAAGLSDASTSSSSSSSSSSSGSVAEDLDAGGALSLAMEAGSLGLGSLPTGAPRTVKIGVVLVQFSGAEGAPATARPKAAALAIAQRLVEDAKANFGKAVSEGDHGSSSDIGRIPRGVLDPRTEVTVFGLTAGEVSDVLETPRGYWIVKRID